MESNYTTEPNEMAVPTAPVRTWRERLLEERGELEYKLNKLDSFLNKIADDVAEGKEISVSAKYQRLLSIQKSAITTYYLILTERLIDLNIIK